jgi:hypothetical protein
MARYCAAWMLDPGNTRAALETARLIAGRHDELDPSGLVQTRLTETYDGLIAPPNLLRKVVDRIPFPRERRARLTEADYDNLRRMYAILSSVAVPAASPAEAARIDVRQARLAVESEAKLKSVKGETRDSPGLYLSLAEAYRKAGDTAQAAKQYLRAAEIFTIDAKPEEAERAARMVLQLGPLVQAADRARAEKIMNSAADGANAPSRNR